MAYIYKILLLLLSWPKLIKSLFWGLTGTVWLAIMVLLAMKSIRLYCPGSFEAAADLSHTDTMRSFFAQQDRLGVLDYVIDGVKFHEYMT